MKSKIIEEGSGTGATGAPRKRVWEIPANVPDRPVSGALIIVEPTIVIAGFRNLVKIGASAPAKNIDCRERRSGAATSNAATVARPNNDIADCAADSKSRPKGRREPQESAGHWTGQRENQSNAAGSSLRMAEGQTQPARFAISKRERIGLGQRNRSCKRNAVS